MPWDLSQTEKFCEGAGFLGPSAIGQPHRSLCSSRGARSTFSIRAGCRRLGQRRLFHFHAAQRLWGLSGLISAQLAPELPSPPSTSPTPQCARPAPAPSGRLAGRSWRPAAISPILRVRHATIAFAAFRAAQWSGLQAALDRHRARPRRPSPWAGFPSAVAFRSGAGKTPTPPII